MSKKKKSIREFVSEPSLKFQLYLLKYSKHLKELKEKTPQEIQEKFIKDTDRKIKSWEEKECNPLTAERNISYLKSLKPFDNEEYIKSEFEKHRKEYISYLKNEIKEHNKKIDKELLEYAQNIELTENVSKEKFGQMLLLIIKNLANMPSFIGYTENWKTDFYSNAIEKTLLYLGNFDENILSKRTGKKSNAFAYITQICFNAFVNIINIRKSESEFLSKTISLESANLDGVRSLDDLNKEQYFLWNPEDNIYYKELRNVEDIENGFLEVIEHNKNIDKNKIIDIELEMIERETSEDEKKEFKDDYDSYTKDLISKKIKLIDDKKFDSIYFIKNDFKTEEVINIINNLKNTITEIDTLNVNIADKPIDKKPKEKVKDEVKIEDLYSEW